MTTDPATREPTTMTSTRKIPGDTIAVGDVVTYSRGFGATATATVLSTWLEKGTYTRARLDNGATLALTARMRVEVTR